MHSQLRPSLYRQYAVGHKTECLDEESNFAFEPANTRPAADRVAAGAAQSSPNDCPALVAGGSHDILQQQQKPALIRRRSIRATGAKRAPLRLLAFDLIGTRQFAIPLVLRRQALNQNPA